MKNIHLLKTDKPSRLLKNLVDETYQFKKEVLYGNRFELPLNIYITSSDEEIKDGYFLDLTHNIVMKAVFYPSSDKNCKKIILTTDSDLIKDGVQAIDDEFLEWFVKNSSCERVDVRFFCCGGYDDKCEPKCFRKSYEIIIPKEEPKQDLEKEMFELEQELDIPSYLRWHNSKPKQKTLPKQETLEEAITLANKTLHDLNFDKHRTTTQIITEALLTFSSKWQQEQDKNKYSEEEVIAILENFSSTFHLITTTPKKWLEQFKNK